MINIKDIKNKVLADYILSNSDFIKVSEQEFIKNTIDFILKSAKSLDNFQNELSKYGIKIENYFSKKESQFKLSYKTYRLSSGISEDKLGDNYSFNNIVKKINSNNLNKVIKDLKRS